MNNECDNIMKGEYHGEHVDGQVSIQSLLPQVVQPGTTDADKLAILLVLHQILRDSEGSGSVGETALRESGEMCSMLLLRGEANVPLLTEAASILVTVCPEHRLWERFMTYPLLSQLLVIHHLMSRTRILITSDTILGYIRNISLGYQTGHSKFMWSLVDSRAILVLSKVIVSCLILRDRQPDIVSPRFEEDYLSELLLDPVLQQTDTATEVFATWGEHIEKGGRLGAKGSDLVAQLTEDLQNTFSGISQISRPEVYLPVIEFLASCLFSRYTSPELISSIMSLCFRIVQYYPQLNLEATFERLSDAVSDYVKSPDPSRKYWYTEIQTLILQSVEFLSNHKSEQGAHISVGLPLIRFAAAFEASVLKKFVNQVVGILQQSLADGLEKNDQKGIQSACSVIKIWTRAHSDLLVGCIQTHFMPSLHSVLNNPHISVETLCHVVSALNCCVQTVNPLKDTDDLVTTLIRILEASIKQPQLELAEEVLALLSILFKSGSVQDASVVEKLISGLFRPQTIDSFPCTKSRLTFTRLAVTTTGELLPKLHLSAVSIVHQFVQNSIPSLFGSVPTLDDEECLNSLQAVVEYYTSLLTAVAEGSTGGEYLKGLSMQALEIAEYSFQVANKQVPLLSQRTQVDVDAEESCSVDLACSTYVMVLLDLLEQLLSVFVPGLPDITHRLHSLLTCLVATRRVPVRVHHMMACLLQKNGSKY